MISPCSPCRAWNSTYLRVQRPKSTTSANDMAALCGSTVTNVRCHSATTRLVYRSSCSTQPPASMTDRDYHARSSKILFAKHGEAYASIPCSTMISTAKVCDMVESKQWLRVSACPGRPLAGSGQPKLCPSMIPSAPEAACTANIMFMDYDSQSPSR